MTDEERADELYTRFLETEEMQDWDEFVEETRKALEANPNAETVAVPATFLRACSPITSRPRQGRRSWSKTAPGRRAVSAPPR